MADEHQEIEAIMGPYRGKRLTVTAADAENAINDHWAIDPFKVADASTRHTEGEPLTEEERTHALEAAQAWADAQLAASQGQAPPPEPPPEGSTRKRAVQADEDEGSGRYKTRGR